LPNVAAAGVVKFFKTIAEDPFHPGAQVKAALPNVAAAGVVRYFFNQQEIPFHPGPLCWNFIPLVRAPGIAFAKSVQEQPDHPGPSLYPAWLFQAPTFRPPGIAFAATQQESPYHPNVSGVFAWPLGFGFLPPPPTSVPATYYMLEDYWISDTYYLPAGTIQQTADFPGGKLPLNWVPGPNVDPVDANAIVAYTVVGYQTRGLMRRQYFDITVTPPNYVWQQKPDGTWILVKVASWPRVQ
jgi:hypothetical protein